MHFTQTAFAAILAFTSSAAASPLAARQSALQDWQVTRVNVYTPSGRPGSYPWASITADVTDPNVIDLGPAEFDNTTVTAPAGSQGLVRLNFPVSYSSTFADVSLELQSAMVYQWREPPRPDLAVRWHIRWLLGHERPGGKRWFRNSRLHPEVYPRSRRQVPGCAIQGDV